MFKCTVYQGISPLGEVEIYPQNMKLDISNKEIRISHFSQPSDRCPPLAVLHTIAPLGLCLKMEAKPQETPLLALYSTCFTENKTAVIPLGEEELHLVALPSRRNVEQHPSFWGFSIRPGLYDSCLLMLNLRCLGIVFDLDETLIVANTMRSFEDRIEALQRKINGETDPQRVSGILAEIMRYQDDRNILKQYAESDQVIENGKVIKVQSEVVPPLSDNHQPMIRPLIRLEERNIILTRINPMVRDTSVLVRLRPAWDDLRNYLTAKGRKRFEVYVCTMAERDYALEMWRLLDPGSNLINAKELLERIVCVKSGSRKSLLNVFQDGMCHPKMALVIDDRLKVWEDKDQPRVHVVPAFAPYYAPQAEANSAVPILCVARNVACSVRGGFFKDFDDVLIQKVMSIYYEDGASDFPSAPDVSHYLFSSEDDGSVLNGGKDSLCFDGTTDSEVERKLKEATCTIPPALSHILNNVDAKAMPPFHKLSSSSSIVSQATPQGSTNVHTVQYAPTVTSTRLPHIGPSDPSIQASPAREEGEVPESELDPDTRRRLLILQHGQDTRDQPQNDPPFPMRAPIAISTTSLPSRGGWFGDDGDMGRSFSRTTKELSLGQETSNFDRPHIHSSSYFPGLENHVSSDRSFRENQRLSKDAYYGDDRLSMNPAYSNYPSSGEEVPFDQRPTRNKHSYIESGWNGAQYPETPVKALQDIAMKCGTMVEFKMGLASTIALQFTYEILFFGEKIGEGSGRTRKEAQLQAAENSLLALADKYLSYVKMDEMSFLEESNSSEHLSFPREDSLATATSEQSRLLDHRQGGFKRTASSSSSFQDMASEDAIGSLRFPTDTPRSLQTNKRLKPELPQGLQRLHSLTRYPRSTPSVP